MLQILLVTTDPEPLSEFLTTLTEDREVRLQYAASGVEALEQVRATPPHLVIIDRTVSDCTPFDLVSSVLSTNAMVNTAVVSTLSEEAFHEAYEGLGVLDHLSPPLGPEDGRQILEKLRRILGL
ncbi:MAG: hypothetical protein ACLFTB_02375 [Desulfovibrionales bacterium]